MDNQHKQIKGYRDLSQAEIDLMNEIKGIGAQIEGVVARVTGTQTLTHMTPDQMAEARRWTEVAKTNLQIGLMALTRAVALPTTF
ncbi:Transposase [Burkholderia pseudomallei]